MNPIDQRAEQAILEAQQKGELDDLPGTGRPLVLDDDSMIPPALRAAYRLLKNAGFVPREIQLRNDIQEAEAILMDCNAPDKRSQTLTRLHMLRAQLSAVRGNDSLVVDDFYFRKLVQKISKGQN